MCGPMPSLQGVFRNILESCCLGLKQDITITFPLFPLHQHLLLLRLFLPLPKSHEAGVGVEGLLQDIELFLQLVYGCIRPREQQKSTRNTYTSENARQGDKRGEQQMFYARESFHMIYGT